MVIMNSCLPGLQMHSVIGTNSVAFLHLGFFVLFWVLACCGRCFGVFLVFICDLSCGVGGRGEALDFTGHK